MFNKNITKELFNRFVYCNYLLELQKYDKFLENEKLSFENAKKLLEKCVEELKNRYDLAFASLIVKNMKEQKLLADDRLAELIK